MPGSFQRYIEREIRDILQACTGCGICAEVCPILPYTTAAGRDPKRVVEGVLDILRGGPGSGASASWIEACAGSGVCVKQCPEPVNPRRMLLLARNGMKRKEP
jgi:heterodisulfide reductase subunit D